MTSFEPKIQNNVEKLSVYLTLIAINYIAFWVYVKTPQIGTDYRAFYVAGQAARSDRYRIYDLSAQYSAQVSQFGSIVPFFHAPHELLIFAPLSVLSFHSSLIAWRILSALFLIVSGILLAKSRGLPLTIGIAILASVYPISICMQLAQDSLLLLLVLTGTYVLLRKELDSSAGILLSLALFKPQLPLLLALALLVTRRLRFVTSFAGAGLLIAAASTAYIGLQGWIGLIKCARVTEQLLAIWPMPNIRGVIALCFGDHQKIAAALSVVIIATFVLIWNKYRSLDFVVSSAVCVYCIAAHHVYGHDLVVLALPLLLYSQLPRLRHDPLLLIAFLGAPLFIMLYHYKLSALMLLPTVCLCAACFRMRTSE